MLTQLLALALVAAPADSAPPYCNLGSPVYRDPGKASR
jgi:hypothetical protein